jgi:hypothetical protein
VVRAEDHELLGRPIVGRRAEALAAERRVLAVVEVRAAREALGQRLHRAELLVVALAIAREQDAERVVEVVGPDRVVPEPPERGGAHDPRVVEARLRDEDRTGPRRPDALAEDAQQRRALAS